MHASTRLAALTATALLALGGLGAGSALAGDVPAGDTPDPVDTGIVIERPDLDVGQIVKPDTAAVPFKPDLGDLIVRPGDDKAVIPPEPTTPAPEPAPSPDIDVIAKPDDSFIKPSPKPEPDVQKPASGPCPAGEPALSASAVDVTRFEAPGLGGGQRFGLEGRHFRPNTTLRIVLRNYPAADPSQTEIELSATTDGDGNLVATFFFGSELPERDFAGDADVDVWVTVTDGNGCAAMTRIKVGRILHPTLP